MVNVYKCRCGYRFFVNVKQSAAAELRSLQSHDEAQVAEGTSRTPEQGAAA